LTTTPKYILGISAFYHDSAACLLRDGQIVAAAQEERFTRNKGDASFPAIGFCLKQGGITAKDLTYVGFYDKPLLKFERILETYLGVAPRGFTSFLKAAPLWIKDKLYMEKQIRDGLGYDGEILYAEHHESHAASAFFPSPFEEAGILTMDGVGEWATASFGVGRGNDIELFEEIRWPDSLGLLYSAFTYHTGFKVNSGEYKVMGLAPYGEPKYVDTILTELVDLREDGSFTLNQKYFNYLTGLTMTNGEFDKLFGGPPRVPESKLTQREMNLARSVQSRRWRGAQLRGEREDPARGAVRESLDPAGSRRCGRRPGNRPAHLAPPHATAAHGDTGEGLDGGRLSRTRVQRRSDRGVSPVDRRPIRAARAANAPGEGRPTPVRGERRGMVQRADGVRPSGAGLAEHPGRRPEPAHAETGQPQDQVSRRVPSLCAERVTKPGKRLLRDEL
jgi:hypothetical protein